MYYMAWMDMIYGSIKGLVYFNNEQKLWGQAHILASYVIFSVVREADKDLIKFEFCERDGKDYFNLKIDRPKIRTVAFEALSKFLHKLHVYKSIGDFDAAKKMFDHYSVVDEEMLKVKVLVEAWRIPRRLEQQPNLHYDAENDDAKYKDYTEGFEGIISSYVERYEPHFLGDVYQCWLRDADHFRRHI